VSLDLGRALMWAGRFGDAIKVLDGATHVVQSRSDPVPEWRLRVLRSNLELTTQTGEAISDHVRAELEQAIAVFEDHDDGTALAEAWHTMTLVHNMRSDMGAMHDAARRVLTYAQRAGKRRLEADAYGPLGGALVAGPVPVRAGIEEMEAELVTQTDLRMQAGILLTLADLRALNGELNEARALRQRASREFDNLGMRFGAAIAAWGGGQTERLAQEWTSAESYLRDAYGRFTEMGDRAWRSTLAAELGEVVYELGGFEEALRLAEVSEELAAPDDNASQVLWRCVRAKVMARRGELEQAEALARAAVSLVRDMKTPLIHGQAVMDLAEVLQIAGRPDEASQAVSEALRIYEAKGAVPQVERAREILSAITS
jgi:tetratricopeptide (TPR) repeat protein